MYRSLQFPCSMAIVNLNKWPIHTVPHKLAGGTTCAVESQTISIGVMFMYNILSSAGTKLISDDNLTFFHFTYCFSPFYLSSALSQLLLVSSAFGPVPRLHSSSMPSCSAFGPVQRLHSSSMPSCYAFRPVLLRVTSSVAIRSHNRCNCGASKHNLGTINEWTLNVLLFSSFYFLAFFQLLPW